MNLPTNFRCILIIIILLIWAYLSYCWFFNHQTHQTKKTYDYKARVDSTISLLKEWRTYILDQAQFQVNQSESEKDSLLIKLDSLKKIAEQKPKIIIKYEKDPKLDELQSKNELQNTEIVSLKKNNQKLQSQVDSLSKLLVKQNEQKKINETTPKKDLSGNRSIWSRIFKRKNKSSGNLDGTPNFR